MAQRKLKKELSLLDVICVSAGVMISSGLFILPALAYEKTGPSMILSYLIGSILIIPTIFSKSELVSAMPKTGGIFFFTDRSMGPLTGCVAGIVAWLSLAFKSAFSLLAIGIFVILLKPDITLVQIKIIAVLCCLFFMVVNITGVKLTGKIQKVLVITLVVILIIYILLGMFSIQINRFSPFAPKGVSAIITTAGFIFISFAGTSKIAAIAGEVKNPGRNIPLGMFYSWGIVSVLYVFVVFVTVGILDKASLSGSLIPLSLGGEVLMGKFGLIFMSVAALLAFVSTGNAGLLAASRDPMAMGKDELLPSSFSKVSKAGTPWVSIAITTLFMITVILFLDIDSFVKTASALKLFLFILANLAIIFMREGNIAHYSPKYKAPLYPWVQIAGIIAYSILFLKMGKIPVLFVGILIVLSLIWYFVFAYGKIKREYAILHIVERITGIKKTDQLLDEELREIIIERDNITRKRFIKLIKQCPLLDFEHSLPLSKVTNIATGLLSRNLNTSQRKIMSQLVYQERMSETIISSGIACVCMTLDGVNKFEILVVRNIKGIHYKDYETPIYAGFVIARTNDTSYFHLHVLSWIVEIATSDDFQEKWLELNSEKELKELLISPLKKKSKELPF
jgi:amino acid transporter/mannitol/fructose-specific phosphotransferase system IIA component (Ntr-type)